MRTAIKFGGAVLVASAIFCSAGYVIHQSADAKTDDACDLWHTATVTTGFAESNDLYRLCGERLEVMTIEDEHNSVVRFAISE